MPRTFEEIRRDQEGTSTVRNLVAVLDTKLRLAAQYGVYEYEAAQEGEVSSATLFFELARDERAQIERLLVVLREPHARGRFYRLRHDGGNA